MIGWRVLVKALATTGLATLVSLLVVVNVGAALLDTTRERTIWVVAVALGAGVVALVHSWADWRARRRVAFSLTAEPGLPEGRMKVTLNSSGVLSPVVVLQVLASTLDMMDQVPVSGGSVVLSVDMISEAGPSEARDR